MKVNRRYLRQAGAEMDQALVELDSDEELELQGVATDQEASSSSTEVVYSGGA